MLPLKFSIQQASTGHGAQCILCPYSHNAQETQLWHFLRADSDSTLILMASSRISRANFLISSAQRCWASIFPQKFSVNMQQMRRWRLLLRHEVASLDAGGTITQLALIEAQLMLNPTALTRWSDTKGSFAQVVLNSWHSEHLA
jgi:hypothetical protein